MKDDITKPDYYNEELFRDYVGSKYNDYYKDKWYGMNYETWFLSWNWAGLLGATWLVYRKMYMEAIAYTVIVFFITILFWNGSLLAIVLRLFFPAVANCLYYKKTYRIVKKEIDRGDVHMDMNLRKKGGTTIGGALLFEFILFLIQI